MYIFNNPSSWHTFTTLVKNFPEFKKLKIFKTIYRYLSLVNITKIYILFKSVENCWQIGYTIKVGRVSREIPCFRPYKNNRIILRAVITAMIAAFIICLILIFITSFLHLVSEEVCRAYRKWVGRLLG
jgi:hypothetical protein